MNSKKTGGLTHNPLLTRTEPSPLPAGAPSTPVDMHTRIPAYPQTDVDGPSATAVEASERASKFTFYFTPQQLDRLDNAWAQLRRRHRGTKQRASKSQFVRVALDRLLDDFERNPDDVIELLLNHQDR